MARIAAVERVARKAGCPLALCATSAVPRKTHSGRVLKSGVERFDRGESPAPPLAALAIRCPIGWRDDPRQQKQALRRLYMGDPAKSEQFSWVELAEGASVKSRMNAGAAGGSPSVHLPVRRYAATIESLPTRHDLVLIEKCTICMSVGSVP